MRVGIDGRAFSSPAAGVRRYVNALVPALQALGGLDLIALGGAAGPHGLPHVAEPAHPPSNAGWAIVGLPRAAAAARVDVIHAPAYTGPLWSRVPVVLTIHDVSYARHPEWYPYRNDWLRRSFYRRSAHAAAHILTDSEFSASEIVAAYGIARARITVVPLGVGGEFTNARGPVPPAPFVLHVGDLHRRRNLQMVARAVFEVRRRESVPLRLVLAGVDRGIGDELASIAAAEGDAGAIEQVGSVDDRALRALYGGALALVYPSRYEGFGLPVLEAMAAGTPVIAAAAGSIPEVAGDAAILLGPDDDAAWVNAITQVLRDAALRSRMSARGVARAAGFTWARTARMTADIYARVARQP